MTDKIYNVLFLCTGNSARSILAEAIMNRAGQGRFKAYFGRLSTEGRIHPYTLDLLRNTNFDTGLRSVRRTGRSSPSPARRELDFVFTVCDNAANESCPCLGPVSR